MRNIHLFIQQRNGQESVKDLWNWEKIEKKMTDFKNHRKFSLRCLSKNIIPVSLRLKSNIKMTRGLNILKKAERALLNERIRNINNTLQMLEHQRVTCMNQLYRVLGQEVMEECKVFMNETKEARHFNTLEWQKAKFERLCMKMNSKGGHSKDENMSMHRYMYHSGNNPEVWQTATTTTASKTTSKWVINMSRNPLTGAQKQLLAHGTNFTILPRSPPIGNALQQLNKPAKVLPRERQRNWE